MAVVCGSVGGRLGIVRGMDRSDAMVGNVAGHGRAGRVPRMNPPEATPLGPAVRAQRLSAKARIEDGGI